MYLEHYGLDRLPFQITPDARFFFESRGHRRAEATILYGLSKGEGFVVVTGEIGAGKTTLIERLLGDGRLADVVVARINTTQLESETLLHLIALQLGVGHGETSKASLLHALAGAFRATADDGRRTLLIVDEVQALSAGALEELRMLSNIQEAERPLLQTLLVGQPEFRARLAQPSCEQIRQRVVASYHLAPLSVSDVPHYIAFRLKQGGPTCDALFTPEAVARIAQETGGVPRRINRLCDRVLLYGYLEGRHELDENAVADVVADMHGEDLEVAPLDADAHAPDAGAVAELTDAGLDRVNGAAARKPNGGGDLRHDVEVLRRQLAAYKQKLARISEVIQKDGRIGSGRGRWS